MVRVLESRINFCKLVVIFEVEVSNDLVEFRNIKACSWLAYEWGKESI